jgi:hypothetical protein
MDAALGPVRTALLARARAEADSVRERCEADADRAVAAATAQAELVRRAARADGEREAAAASAADRRRARREARALVLDARREAYERLAHAARDAVLRLATEPEFRAVRQRMVAAIHTALGSNARIVDAPGGGVLGVDGGRRLDLSLSGFADRAVPTVLAGEAEQGATSQSAAEEEP